MDEKRFAEAYKAYMQEESKVYNEVLREKGESFGDFMSSGSIVEGLDEEVGREILEIIKNAGMMYGYEKINQPK